MDDDREILDEWGFESGTDPLTLRQIADTLGVSRNYVWRQVVDKRLRATHLGFWRVRLHDLAAWLRGRCNRR